VSLLSRVFRRLLGNRLMPKRTDADLVDAKRRLISLETRAAVYRGNPKPKHR